MKSFAIRAHQQGLELACCIHPEVPQLVVGDYSRLRQIIVNLVGNAIKFTETGEVSLEVTRQSHSQRDVALDFVVADTGIGIPPEKRSTIFEMFEQADASTTRRHGGTGLGLAIAARLIGLMGGRIWLESEVGRGSRFHFAVRLSLAESEPAEPLSLEPASIHGMRVLAVDDNATNRRILEEILRSWQMIPSTAPSATEAVKLLLEARQKRQPFGLVLTDAHMPRVDGFMLAEQIRRDATLGGTVVMMLTSGDRPDDIQRCEELGRSLR
jgi:CheY-like chemotaxis protein